MKSGGRFILPLMATLLFGQAPSGLLDGSWINDNADTPGLQDCRFESYVGSHTPNRLITRHFPQWLQ
jgi:hypothetical protein